MFQNIGIPGLLLIAVVVLVLFGKGITAFKKGVNEGAAEIEREKTETKADATPVPGTDAQNVTPPSDKV